MPLIIAAVGRLRRGPLTKLYDDYAARIKGPPLGRLDLRDLAESRSEDRAGRQAKESHDLLARTFDLDRRVVLDERGQSLPSAVLAQKLGAWASGGNGKIGFIIGSDAGLSEDLRGQADLVLALGPQTWPHQLIRVMLVEQLYRAQCILTGHPYHRAD